MVKLNKKYFYLKLLIIISFGIGSIQIQTFSQELSSSPYQGRDSLLIKVKKNFPKSYNWDSLTKKYPSMEQQCLLISREKLEDIDLKYYAQKGFKYLYDSLSSKYKSFNDCIYSYFPELGENELIFHFSIDSCNIYNLILFIAKIPDKRIIHSKKKLISYALKQHEFAVLAYKHDNCVEIRRKKSGAKHGRVK